MSVVINYVSDYIYNSYRYQNYSNIFGLGGIMMEIKLYNLPLMGWSRGWVASIFRGL